MCSIRRTGSLFSFLFSGRTILKPKLVYLLFFLFVFSLPLREQGKKENSLILLLLSVSLIYYHYSAP